RTRSAGRRAASDETIRRSCALPEEDGPETYVRRPFFHGDRIVTRHPHRQLRRFESPISENLSRLACSTECPSELAFGGIHRSHGHHAADLISRQASQSVG